MKLHNITDVFTTELIISETIHVSLLSNVTYIVPGLTDSITFQTARTTQ